MKNLVLLSTDAAMLQLFMGQPGLIGYNVKVMESSEDLLSRLRVEKPDILVMDLILSENNGGSLCHQIKCDQSLSNLRVVLLSDYPAMEQLSSKFGCDCMLQKPLDPLSVAALFNDLNGHRLTA